MGVMGHPTRVTGGRLRVFLAIDISLKRGFKLVGNVDAAIEILAKAVPEVGMGAVLNE